MKRMILTAVLLLAGCGESETDSLKAENQQLRSQVDQLQTQLADVREKADELETKSSDLQDEVARFGSEDWKDVVPAVISASEEVDTAKDDVSEAAAEQ